MNTHFVNFDFISDYFKHFNFTIIYQSFSFKCLCLIIRDLNLIISILNSITFFIKVPLNTFESFCHPLRPIIIFLISLIVFYLKFLPSILSKAKHILIIYSIFQFYYQASKKDCPP